ncbi:protein shisa-5-like [Mercenaria mercenaria]|uniref:protein shisa-5-like n=1 Tax=Mercenaria mercenaria TaxID=6596 RepID=UPI00234EB99F|nr:protein shisa-5-like [Mercenaria mercenaria]
MSASIFWILLLYTLACVVSMTESTTCWYNGYDGRTYFYCPSGGCCGTYGDQYCCTRTGTIVGAVIGCLAFIIVVASIITCCCCACCPVYQYRSQGTIVSAHRAGPNYQTMPDSSPYTSPYPPNTGPYTAKPAGEYTAPPPYQV